MLAGEVDVDDLAGVGEVAAARTRLCAARSPPIARACCSTALTLTAWSLRPALAITLTSLATSAWTASWIARSVSHSALRRLAPEPRLRRAQLADALVDFDGCGAELLEAAEGGLHRTAPKGAEAGDSEQDRGAAPTRSGRGSGIESSVPECVADTQAGLVGGQELHGAAEEFTLNLRSG